MNPNDLGWRASAKLRGVKLPTLQCVHFNIGWRDLLDLGKVIGVYARVVVIPFAALYGLWKVLA